MILKKYQFLAQLFVAVILGFAITSCASESPTPTAAFLPGVTQVIPSATPTLGPSETVTSSATVTVTATLLPTSTSTSTPTATFTLPPSLTATRTPTYNLMGLYKIGRCVQFGFTYGEPAPGGTGLVNMCLIDVQVNKDHSMQFDMTWTLVSSTGPKPNRYVYGNMDTIYLTDEFGTRYESIANSGKKPDRDENQDGVDTISGWYLFAAPVKTARMFTLHDDDSKSVSISYLTFVTK